TSGNIGVHAASDDNITSIAGSFGLSTSSAGVAGSISVQVLTTETRAYTEDATTLTDRVSLTAGGDVSITANGDLHALMIGGAIGGGSSAGVGVANTTLVHNDTVEGRIGNPSSVTSAGTAAVAVSAPSAGDISRSNDA